MYATQFFLALLAATAAVARPAPRPLELADIGTINERLEEAAEEAAASRVGAEKRLVPAPIMYGPIGVSIISTSVAVSSVVSSVASVLPTTSALPTTSVAVVETSVLPSSAVAVSSAASVVPSAGVLLAATASTQSSSTLSTSTKATTSTTPAASSPSTTSTPAPVTTAASSTSSTSSTVILTVVNGATRIVNPTTSTAAAVKKPVKAVGQ